MIYLGLTQYETDRHLEEALSCTTSMQIAKEDIFCIFEFAFGMMIRVA